MSPAQHTDQRTVAAIALVKYASKHSSFYGRMTTAEGLPASLIEDERAFVQLPVLSRRRLLTDQSDVSCRTDRQRRFVHTSGTSEGLVARIPIDVEGRARGRALLGRIPAVAALDNGAPALAVNYYRDRASRHATERSLRAIMPRLRWRAVDVGMSLPKVIRRWRPALVYGRPRSLVALAAAWPSGSVDPPAVALSSDEVLEPPVRSFVEQRLGTHVLDIYSMRELSSCIAWQHERGGEYLAPAEGVLIEVVDEAGDPVPEGAMGRVLVTDLLNYVCPLIRYETGDVATVERRRGHVVEALTRVDGRGLETVVSAAGRHIFVGRLLTELACCLGGPVSLSQDVGSTKLDLQFVPLVPATIGVDGIPDLVAPWLGPGIEVTVRDLPLAAYVGGAPMKWVRVRRPR